MPVLVETPAIIEAAGTKPKIIEEFIGLVNTGHKKISIAKMKSPQGWVEPGQKPEFEEITIVLKGMLKVECENSFNEVKAGQTIITSPGEWVRYSTPNPGGAEYIAVCLPAFAPNTVHRDKG